MLPLLEMHILHPRCFALPLMFIKAGWIVLFWLSKHNSPEPGTLHNEQRCLSSGVLVSQPKKELALVPAEELS